MKTSSVWSCFMWLSFILAVLKVVDDYLPFYSCLIIYNIYLAQGD